MHQTRNRVTSKIPIPRKGTKYVVRSKGSLENSVPVAIAVRDILGLAKSIKEVREMIKEKSLKINGREVKDYHEAIYLFNLLEAGKVYSMTFSKSGKFSFDESKSSKERACKVIGKKMVSGAKIQLNLHDGTNILSDAKVSVGDTVYLDFDKKVVKTLKLEKGKNCFIFAGKYLGKSGKILELENGIAKVELLESGNVVQLKKEVLFVL